ncbi:hypothetical protein I4U23_000473 [Adineta vaga]|nr:hypothetical protein I4U23_000473 [Adineta vaga]
MVTNPHVQSRVKHFELLLSREKVLLERRYDQNISTYKKLEQTIRHESKKIPICSRRKESIPIDELYNEENRPENQRKKRIHSFDNPYNKSTTNQTQFSNEKTSPFLPKYRRLCTKAHRLPPITGACIPSTEKRIHQQRIRQNDNETIDRESEILNDLIKDINDQLSKRTTTETNKVDRQVHSFMDTLPEYKGLQKGFDNFGPSSLYSTRVTVAMK